MASSPRRTGSRCGTKQTGKPSSCSISGAWRCAPTAYGEKFSSTAPACERLLERPAGAGHPRLRVDDDVAGRARRAAARARAASRSRSSRGSRSAGPRRDAPRAARSSRRRASSAVPALGERLVGEPVDAAEVDRRRPRRPAARTRPPARCRGRGRSTSAPLAAASTFGANIGTLAVRGRGCERVGGRGRRASPSRARSARARDGAGSGRASPAPCSRRHPGWRRSAVHDVRIMHISMDRMHHLVLEDGTVFPGIGVGAAGVASGEACFTTAMTGYEEAVTDPSYVAQVLCFAYPLIGTYGVDERADGVGARAVRGRRDARRRGPSSRPGCASAGVVALTGVDTRTLVRKIRDGGVLRCALGDAPVEELRQRALDEPFIDGRPLDRQVGAQRAVLGRRRPAGRRRRPRLEALDPAAARRRRARGLRRPGLVGRRRDPGGRPARRADRERPRRPGRARPTRSRRSARCSAGCRSSASASGTSCSGSRSATRPSSFRSATAARTIPCATSKTGRVLVTVQNHGFAVLANGDISHVSLNDGTCEGPRSATASRASSSIPRPRRARSTPFPSSTAWPTRAEAHRPSLDPDPRLRADPHRPGVRVRLLGGAGLPGAAARGLPRDPRQLEPGDDHDRPRVGRRDLPRAARSRDGGAR